MIDQLEERVRKIVEYESASASMSEWTESMSGIDVPPFNYRFDHVVEAVSIAKHLARETSANYEVVVLATWLHDLAGPWTSENPPDHHAIGAERARDLLLQEGVDSETVERVCDAIRSHGGYTREKPLGNLESQIVWEADKLTKIGVTGTIRNIINGLRYEPYNSMFEILERVKGVLELLEAIAGSIFTEPGRMMAESRLQNAVSIVNMLEEELNLDE